MVSEKIQEISFVIISNVGEAKSLALEAIRASSTKKYSEADKLIDEAESLVVVAEKAHMDLISKEASGETVEFALLLMHAEDQMLSTQTVIILAKEMINIYKKINN